MMADVIYVDNLKNYGAKGLWCHMWCADKDNHNALDRFAKRIGLKTFYAQVGGAMRLYHYDLTAPMRVKAIRAGAIEKSMHEWMRETGNHIQGGE
jgi:hypothetical protein